MSKLTDRQDALWDEGLEFLTDEYDAGDEDEGWFDPDSGLFFVEEDDLYPDEADADPSDEFGAATMRAAGWRNIGGVYFKRWGSVAWAQFSRKGGRITGIVVSDAESRRLLTVNVASRNLNATARRMEAVARRHVRDKYRGWGATPRQARNDLAKWSREPVAPPLSRQQVRDALAPVPAFGAAGQNREFYAKRGYAKQGRASGKPKQAQGNPYKKGSWQAQAWSEGSIDHTTDLFREFAVNMDFGGTDEFGGCGCGKPGVPALAVAKARAEGSGFGANGRCNCGPGRCRCGRIGCDGRCGCPRGPPSTFATCRSGSRRAASGGTSSACSRPTASSTVSLTGGSRWWTR
jgi:hypothetical protein